jgi:hypothetical protein
LLTKNIPNGEATNNNYNFNFKFNKRSEIKNLISKIKTHKDKEDMPVNTLAENPMIKKKTQNYKKEIMNMLSHNNNSSWKKKEEHDITKPKLYINCGKICYLI